MLRRVSDNSNNNSSSSSNSNNRRNRNGNGNNNNSSSSSSHNTRRSRNGTGNNSSSSSSSSNSNNSSNNHNNRNNSNNNRGPTTKRTKRSRQSSRSPTFTVNIGSAGNYLRNKKRAIRRKRHAARIAGTNNQGPDQSTGDHRRPNARRGRGDQIRPRVNPDVHPVLSPSARRYIVNAVHDLPDRMRGHDFDLLFHSEDEEEEEEEEEDQDDPVSERSDDLRQPRDDSDDNDGNANGGRSADFSGDSNAAIAVHRHSIMPPRDDPPHQNPTIDNEDHGSDTDGIDEIPELELVDDNDAPIIENDDDSPEENQGENDETPEHEDALDENGNTDAAAASAVPPHALGAGAVVLPLQHQQGGGQQQTPPPPAQGGGQPQQAVQQQPPPLPPQGGGQPLQGGAQQPPPPPPQGVGQPQQAVQQQASPLPPQGGGQPPQAGAQQQPPPLPPQGGGQLQQGGAYLPLQQGGIQQYGGGQPPLPPPVPQQQGHQAYQVGAAYQPDPQQQLQQHHQQLQLPHDPYGHPLLQQQYYQYGQQPYPQLAQQPYAQYGQQPYPQYGQQYGGPAYQGGGAYNPPKHSGGGAAAGGAYQPPQILGGPSGPQQLKHRTELLNQLANAMKVSSTTPGTYAGALHSPETNLNYKNDPVMFVRKIAEALKLVGMDSLYLKGDRQVWIEGQPARLPQRDSSTHLRILFLHRMLPPVMAVTRTGTATRRIAMQSLNSISLLQGESWASALDRLAIVYRAATVTPDRPALSEEDYFWQVITTEALRDLCDRAILLCCPAPGQDTFSLQMQQMRTVHALDESDFHEDSAGECYEADDPDLAAFRGAAVAAATPSDDTADGHRRARGDTPYGRRQDITARDIAAAMGDENQLFYESNKTELALRLAAFTAATQDAPPQDEPATEQGTPDAAMSHQTPSKWMSRIRQRCVAAGDVKPFHRRPGHLQHDFEDEHSHLVWSSDLGLQSTSVVAVPLYTLTSRRVSQNANGTGAWTWEYRGRYQDGAQSDCITEDEARDSFSPLQLDVFHALWELHNPDAAPRPPGELTRGEREVESRERALEIFPRGTEVGRIFTDAEGRSKTFKATVYDYCDPYWRAEYPDGDWEELTRREVAEGIGVLHSRRLMATTYVAAAAAGRLPSSAASVPTRRGSRSRSAAASGGAASSAAGAGPATTAAPVAATPPPALAPLDLSAATLVPIDEDVKEMSSGASWSYDPVLGHPDYGTALETGRAIEAGTGTADAAAAFRRSLAHEAVAKCLVYLALSAGLLKRGGGYVFLPSMIDVAQAKAMPPPVAPVRPPALDASVQEEVSKQVAIQLAAVAGTKGGGAAASVAGWKAMEELIQLTITIGTDDLVDLRKTLENVLRRGNDLILDGYDPVYVLRLFSELLPSRRAGRNSTRHSDRQRLVQMWKAQGGGRTVASGPFVGATAASATTSAALPAAQPAAAASTQSFYSFRYPPVPQLSPVEAEWAATGGVPAPSRLPTREELFRPYVAGGPARLPWHAPVWDTAPGGSGFVPGLPRRHIEFWDEVAAEMCFMTSIDDASAFHHIGIYSASWPLLGFSYEGVDYGMSMSVAIRPAALYTQAMFATVAALEKSGAHAVDLSADSHEGPWQLARHFAAKLTLGASDASSLAWGGVVFAREEFRAGGVFPSEWMPKHINFKEMYALHHLLLQFCEAHPEVLRRAQVLIDVDNTAVVGAFTRGRAKVRAAHDLLVQMFRLQVDYGFLLSLKWVPTAENVVADAISRPSRDTIIRLKREVFLALYERLGPFNIDLMACAASVQSSPRGLPLRFFSQCSCVGTAGADVLAQDVSVLPGTQGEAFGFCFPPPVMVGPVLQHLRECQAHAVLLAPDTKAFWFPLLKSATMAVHYIGQTCARDQGTANSQDVEVAYQAADAAPASTEFQAMYAACRKPPASRKRKA
eukprot:g14988.t1